MSRHDVHRSSVGEGLPDPYPGPVVFDVGSLSPDGHWYWDGQDWLAALSSDGHWRWDGEAWVSTSRPTLLRSLWNPGWTRGDTKATVLWATLPPVTFAVFMAGLWTTREPTQSEVITSVLVTLALWPLLGGFLVHTRGRWREVPVLAGAFTLAMCVVYVIAIFAQPDPHNQNDHIAGIGAILTAVVFFPPSLVLVGLGRVVRRAGVAVFGRRATHEPLA